MSQNEWLLISFLFFLVLIIILQRKEIKKRIKEVKKREWHRANKDHLTDLPNKNFLLDTFNDLTSDDEKKAVLFLDLDRFKNVNDAHGHTVGDKLIQAVAERIQSCVRNTDFVARVSGDEFVIILNNIGKDTEKITAISRTILTELQKSFSLDEATINITASIGITLFPQDGSEIQSLITQADYAMYLAKEKGKNQYQFYVAEMTARAGRRLRIESFLYEALHKNLFHLHYQPIVDQEQAIVGIECLIRLQSPTNGIIPPSEFIPLAEESTLIHMIGEWVLRTACAVNKAWQNKGYPKLRIGVNLSPRQFRHQKLLECIDEILTDSKLPAQYLGLEITESVTLTNTSHVISILKDLNKRGVQICLDDFGTGASSLTHLQRLPIDVVKLDRSYIQGIPKCPENTAIVKSVISMAHNLKKKVVAEGVETQTQFEFLKSLGCDMFQGFYFAKPLIISEFTEMLSRNRIDKPPKIRHR